MSSDRTSNNDSNGKGHGRGDGHTGGQGKPELFVDGDPFQWNMASITGAQIRALAHLPQSVLIYQHIPGNPDRLISDETTVDLRPPGPERFSSQAPGSQAGGWL